MVYRLCLVLCNPTSMACSHANVSAVPFPTILQGLGQGQECKDNHAQASSVLVLILTDTALVAPAGKAALVGPAVLAWLSLWGMSRLPFARQARVKFARGLHWQFTYPSAFIRVWYLWILQNTVLIEEYTAGLYAKMLKWLAFCCFSLWRMQRLQGNSPLLVVVTVSLECHYVFVCMTLDLAWQNQKTKAKLNQQISQLNLV